jgi:hypothetical protein
MAQRLRECIRARLMEIRRKITPAEFRNVINDATIQVRLNPTFRGPTELYPQILCDAFPMPHFQPYSPTYGREHGFLYEQHQQWLYMNDQIRACMSDLGYIQDSYPLIEIMSAPEPAWTLANLRQVAGVNSEVLDLYARYLASPHGFERQCAKYLLNQYIVQVNPILFNDDDVFFAPIEELDFLTA